MNIGSTSNMNSISNPLVSIAIPAYKRKWLAEAIESALSQDYSNIELIIVDDHSPQNLKEVVVPYLSDKRVRYYYNEVNLGSDSIVLNWNRCIDLAYGEYFVLLCDDDILFPNFVSTLLALSRKYPYCDVFHGRRIIKNEETGNCFEDKQWEEFISYQNFVMDFNFMKYRHTITEFLFRVDAIKKKKYKVYPLGWGSDDYSIVNFAHPGGIASSSECVALFRWNDEHISSDKKNLYIKCITRIQEYKDFEQLPDTHWTHKQLTDLMDSELLYHSSPLSFYDMLRFLLHVPNEVWTTKQKIIIIIRKLLS